jgi:hypothetical protein
VYAHPDHAAWLNGNAGSSPLGENDLTPLHYNALNGIVHSCHDEDSPLLSSHTANSATSSCSGSPLT